VELRSFDGTVELEGNLIAYDGAYYQIDTIYGPLTVSAEGVSCAGPGCPDLTSFVAEAYIAGAATVAEGLLPDLLSAFGAQQELDLVRSEDGGTIIYTLVRPGDEPAARFYVTPGTTDEGFLALLNGEVDIALALREPNAPERLAARDQAPEDPPLTRRVRVLALDALVPVVSRDNPVASLAMGDLARLFSGEIDNWADLGGPDAPVALHLLAPAWAVAGFRRPGPDVDGSAAGARHHPTPERDRPRPGRGAGRVRGRHHDALHARHQPGPAPDGPCGFSQSASADAIKSEDYPFTAPVYVYLAPYRLPQLVRQFLDFTASETAERIVQGAGYVNQSLTRTPLNLQGDRLSNAIRAAGEDVTLEALQAMMTRLDGAERLSPTFRFADGAAETRHAIPRVGHDGWPRRSRPGSSTGAPCCSPGFPTAPGRRRSTPGLRSAGRSGAWRPCAPQPTAPTPASPCAPRPSERPCRWPARTPTGAAP
jgi:phosphate transport system substrate-binding protein